MSEIKEDELFSPSLQDTSSRPFGKPWSLRAQFWVAFFGGSLAVTVFAYYNSRRLEMSEGARQRILSIGVLAFIITLILAAVFSLLFIETLSEVSDQARTIRLLNRGLAVVIYLIFNRMQEAADRRYQFRYEDDYESAWKPGLMAVFLVGTFHSILIASILAGIALLGG